MPRNVSVGSQGSVGQNLVLDRGITRACPMKSLSCPVLLGLLSTPQTSWQPKTNTNTSGGSYAFRGYINQRSKELDTNLPG